MHQQRRGDGSRDRRDSSLRPANTIARARPLDGDVNISAQSLHFYRCSPRLLCSKTHLRRAKSLMGAPWRGTPKSVTTELSVQVRQAGEPSVVSVVENGQYVEREELVAGASASEVDEAALLLRQRHEPHIAGIAKRAWRFGRSACLTTSWAPRTPAPEDSAAG
jgi:hypothetical protein